MNHPQSIGSSPIITHDFEVKKPALPQKTSSWCGHIFSVSRQAGERLLHGISSTIKETFFVLNTLSSSPIIFSAIIRKLEYQVLTLIEQMRGIPGRFDQLRSILRGALECMDFMLIAADIDYVANRKFTKDNELTIAGRLAFFVADVAGGIWWLGELGLINLSKMAKAVGETRIFKAVPITLTTVINRALGVAFACLAADAYYRMIQPENTQKLLAGLQFATNISELTLNVALAIGMTSVIGLGMLGSVCIALHISSAVYEAKK